MTSINNLAVGILSSIDHLDGEYWETAAVAVEKVLVLLFENGYTSINIKDLLTAEYNRMNSQDLKDFLG